LLSFKLHRQAICIFRDVFLVILFAFTFLFFTNSLILYCGGQRAVIYCPMSVDCHLRHRLWTSGLF